MGFLRIFFNFLALDVNNPPVRGPILLVIIKNGITASAESSWNYLGKIQYGIGKKHGDFHVFSFSGE